MIKTAFIWLDAHPASYWAFVLPPTIALALWLMNEWKAQPADRHRVSWAFPLLMLLVLFAWRWPALLEPKPLNPDEAQLVAGALTLPVDPIPYRGLDMATAGPLAPVALLPTHWLGIPQDYFNARVVAVLLVWAQLCALFGILGSFLAPFRAALAILPALVFYATATDGNFVHFSSELTPLCLGWIGISLLWRCRPTMGAARLRFASWLCGGVILGLLPWLKLQAIPLAFVALAWAALATWFAGSGPLLRRLRPTILLAGASFIPSILLLGTIGITGQLPQFLTSYLDYNLHYMGEGLAMAEVFRDLAAETMRTGIFPAFLGGMLLLTTFGLFAGTPEQPAPAALRWAVWPLLAISIYSVLAPHRAFAHYLHFLVAPLVLVVGIAFAGGRRRGLLALCVAVVAVGQIAVRAVQGPPEIFGHFAEYWRHPCEAVGRQINALKRPGDRLVVWGWWSHLHVETGLPQGTRDGHAERQIAHSPLRDSFFRPRFLEEMRQNRPTFFVDAVGPGSFAYETRAIDGHETFSLLREHIAADYVLVEDHRYARLYMLRTVADERHVGVPLIVPVTLESLVRKTAKVEVAAFDGAENAARVAKLRLPLSPTDPGAFDGACIFAHAPSVLAAAVPAGASRIRGGFGLMPAAFANPAKGTDGAVFVINALDAEGRRTELLRRHMRPLESAEDRVPAGFDLTIPDSAEQIEFLAETGPTGGFDWTFWRNLRFEVPWNRRADQ